MKKFAKEDYDFTFMSADLFQGDNQALPFHEMYTLLFVYIAANSDNNGVLITDVFHLSEVMSSYPLQIFCWLKTMESKGILSVESSRSNVRITITPGLTFHGDKED